MKVIALVKPRSKSDKVEITSANTLVIYVKEPAKNNRANRAVVKLLSQYFSISQTSITIRVGLKSPKKVIEIQGLETLEI